MYQTLFNGNRYISHTLNWQLGGIGDWSSTDHEIGNAMSKISQHSVYPTSRNTARGDGISIADSKYDSGIMPVIFGGAKYHYNTTDAQGRLMEYALPSNYE